MSESPSYEYEVLHQFEVIFRDGEHRTQAATRDYQKVWENVVDNPPEEGVTPIVVYRMNGRTCAAIAGLDDLVDNEECAMEIARLAARVAELEAENAKLHAEFLPLDRAEMRRLIARCDEIVRAASPLTRPDEDWHGAALRILSGAARAEVDKP